MPKILSVIPLPNYKLKLCYDTSEIKTFDVMPYICGSWFGQLKDEAYFKTVHVINNGNGIEWADGQDIAPHELYEMGILCVQ